MSEPQAATPTAAAPRPLRVLIVDDDRTDRELLATTVKLLGCRSDLAENRDGALGRARGEPYDMAFVDLMLGNQSGVDLVPALIAANPNLQVFVITAFGSIDTAVSAVKAGASEYLQKPLDPAKVRSLVERAQDERRLAAGMSASERKGVAAGLPVLHSRSGAMQHAFATVARAAASDLPLLIRGESGTGKGVLAEALHRQSDRAAKPFVTVNCPALTDELLSSELFGHIKGSFTGAVRDQPGKVEAADGGTLFLDELGDLSPTVQAKLLRFLQEKRYERVGDTTTRRADVRIVAATNRDLEAAVREGRFREDLLYRLNVIEVTLPPLRERADDLLELARHFLASFCHAAGRTPMELSPAAERLIAGYPWPGNIRELRNELQRASVLWPSRVVEPDAFSERVRGQSVPAPRIGGGHALAEVENEHIRQVLAKADTFDEAAQILGIEPSTLWRKRKRLGL